jgi:hypothetical protein
MIARERSLLVVMKDLFVAARVVGGMGASDAGTCESGDGLGAQFTNLFKNSLLMSHHVFEL